MIKKAKKNLVLQQDISDCAVACLLSVIKFYGGHDNIENLRNLSGTDDIGTTLLGLYQSARAAGLQAEAYEAEISHLKKLTMISILHLSLKNGHDHFVVLYKYDVKKNVFVIGNPSVGMEFISPDSLLALWKTGAVLTLKPQSDFTEVKENKSRKITFIKKLIKDDLNILFVTAILGLITGILGMAMAVFSQKLIDEIIPKQQITRLVIGLILVFLILCAKGAITYLRQHFLIIQMQSFNERITGNFIEKLLHLPKQFFDSRKTGDLVTRLNDTTRIQRSLAYLSGNFVIDISIILVSIIYLMTFNYLIALISLLSIPLMTYTTYFHNNKITKGQSESMSSYAFNESNFIDTIMGISEIKMFNKQTEFIAKMNRSFGVYQQKNKQLNNYSNKLGILVELSATTIIVVLVSVLAYLTINNEIKLGEMMASISIATGIIPCCVRIVLTNVQIQEAKVAFNRMYEFTSLKPEENRMTIEPNEWDYNFKQLTIENLSFRFTGRKLFLSNINLKIQKGKITVIVGESGGGKSTILQILQKFYVPENGLIVVNNHYNLSNIPYEKWRSIVSTVPQDIKIFNDTIITNICLSEDKRDFISVEQLCIDCGLLSFFSQFPRGLHTTIGEGGINLSGGQKQIVGLLRALFIKPQLLLLDEVTASLDLNSEAFILNLLHSIKNDMAIVMITHRVSTSLIADFKYTLSEGKLVNNYYSKTK